VANKEHLTILKQGVKSWNGWREENSSIRANLNKADLSMANLNSADLHWVDFCGAILIGADLSDADLSMADLRGANLSEANLRGANLREAALSGALLKEADLGGVNFSSADLGMAVLSKANLGEAILSKANLSGANLFDTYLRKAVLLEAKLRLADLRWANLSWADLSEADLSEADLGRADLSKSILIRANLKGADLNRTDLYSADFGAALLNDADFSGANMCSANLKEANLTGAYLFEADLTGVDLSKATLNKTDLSKAIINNTVFGDVDFSEAIGLEVATHRGPSTIGFDTIYRSSGNVPEAFLRGCGFKDPQIAMVKLHRRGLSSAQVTDILYHLHHVLVKGAIHYSSCFISYAHQDKLFAEKIHDDLQKSGVRCWFAPEDMKIGDPIHITIDRAIHRHEKLLLILSEHSIQSDWVEQEIATALEKEQDIKDRVLFPLRVDDAIFKKSNGLVARIKRTRHIGDFRRWRNEQKYQEAFSQVLRDLKTQEA
jgi:uncharacterized protein YjbI with pentapeptide repeats